MNNFANETTVYRRECGSVMAQEELKIEDKTNFHMVLLVFFVTIFVMYLIFGLWHGVTKCKYWKSIKARYLYETRLQTGCCPIKQNGTTKRQPLFGTIAGLIFRSSMFLWIGITAWYWKVNLYAFTNCAYTITWIYYAAGTITSIRGIVGIQSKEKTCFGLDPEGQADWFGYIFAVLYEITSLSVMMTTIIYWWLLADGASLDFHNAMVHGPVNTIMLLIEIFFFAVPTCWANLCTSGLLLQFYYIGISIYYWNGWGCYPYAFLETNPRYAGEDAAWFARIWMLMLSALCMVLHLVLYGFDVAAKVLFSKCYKSQLEAAHCCRPKVNIEEVKSPKKNIEMAKLKVHIAD